MSRAGPVVVAGERVRARDVEDEAVGDEAAGRLDVAKIKIPGCEVDSVAGALC